MKRRPKGMSQSSDIDQLLAVVNLSPGEALSLSASSSDMGEGRQSAGGRGFTEEFGLEAGLDQHSPSLSESSAASEKIVLRPPAMLGSPPSSHPPSIVEESFVLDMNQPPSSPPPDIEDESSKPVQESSE